jgi:acyl-CoA thioester hydrolase
MSVYLKSQKVIKDWIDYNGHMNLSYYILVFDMGAEVILSKFAMGEHSAKTTKKSTMVVETHTNYLKEVKENEEVVISLSHFDHDKKDCITSLKCMKNLLIIYQLLLKF